MSSSDKQKKGFIANIRRRTSFKKGNAEQATDVTSADDRSEIDPLQGSGGAVDDGRMAEDEEKILALERELQAAREEVQKWEKRAAQFENASAELDDDSFDAAQVFQLRKQLADVQGELVKHDDMKRELTDAKQELSELRATNEELEQQQSRKSTRTDIQRIHTEKSTREEVERLHKELRQMERNAKSQASLVEAQLKVSKESLQRAAEKGQALQRRLDLVDKERMDLKLENQRLARKLEKSDSYAEKKRVQMEAESQQMEISNLKRKTVKLEKRLSMSTMNLSDLSEVGPFSIDSTTARRGSRTDSYSRTDSRLSSGTSSPVPISLSEAKMENLEKEVHMLEQQNSALETQNEKLNDELSAAQQKAVILLSQVEHLQVGVVVVDKGGEDTLLTQLPQYQNSLSPQPTENGVSYDEGVVQQLQEDVARLKKDLESKETEMRVRIKEMKATNDELKRQVEELEMEKLRLELGEDEEEEEEGEVTDTEEGEKTEEDAKPVEESDDSEVKVLRERLMSLQDKLLHVSKNNSDLESRLHKQQEEAELFMKSIESELSEVVQAEEAQSRELKLKERNEELESQLKEQQEAINEMMKEATQLKRTIDEQVYIYILCSNIML